MLGKRGRRSFDAGGRKEDRMIDIETCIKKLGYVGVLDFATVDEDGAPQVRNISAIH